MLQRTPACPHRDDPLARLAAEADRCVKCGLCQPECPTYALTRHEADSPRGRIALIEGLARGDLTVTATLDAHLDGCLLCRRCEAVCPSGVRYGELMDRARTLTLRHRPWWLRRAVDLLSRPAAAGLGLRVGQRLPPLPGLAGRFSALAHAAARRRAPPAGSYPALGERRGRVGLFLGCIARHTDAAALHAALHLLRHAGYAVEIPAAQGCCGALHAHLGDAARAARLAAALRQAFGEDLDAIVGVATGCGAHLQDDPAHQGLPAPHVDVLQFLGERLPPHWQWRPLTGSAAIHTPCSQLNGLRGGTATRALLERIPGLRLADLPGNTRCCGAAGSFLLAHPDAAASLRQPKLEALATLRPDWLVTANPGCALHLGDGLRGAGLDIAVVHPVELLARQLVTGTEAVGT